MELVALQCPPILPVIRPEINATLREILADLMVGNAWREGYKFPEDNHSITVI